MLNWFLILAAWILVNIFILRFFAVSSPRFRSNKAHKMKWEEILEIDPFISDDAIKFDNLDECIIAIDHRGYLVYSHNKMVDHFQKDGMSMEEAMEYIDYNVIGVKADHYTVIYD